MARITLMTAAGLTLLCQQLALTQTRTPLRPSPLRVDVRDVTFRAPVRSTVTSDNLPAQTAPVALKVTSSTSESVRFSIKPSAFGGRWIRIFVPYSDSYYLRHDGLAAASNQGAVNQQNGSECPTDPAAYSSGETTATTPVTVCVAASNPDSQYTDGRVPGQIDMQADGAMPTTVTTENVISDRRYLRLLSPDSGDDSASLSGLPLTVSSTDPDRERVLVKVMNDYEEPQEKVGLQIQCSAPFFDNGCGWVTTRFEVNPDQNNRYVGITTDTVSLETTPGQLAANDQNLITINFQSAAPYGGNDFVRVQMDVPNSDPAAAKAQSALFVDGSGFETEVPLSNGGNSETQYDGTLYTGQSNGTPYNPAQGEGTPRSLASLADSAGSVKQGIATKTSGRIAGRGTGALRTGNPTGSFAAGWVDMSLGSTLRGVNVIHDGSNRETAVPLARGAYKTFMVPFDNVDYSTFVSLANRSTDTSSCLVSVRPEGASSAVSENGPVLGAKGSAPLFNTTRLASMRNARGLATFTCTREVIAQVLRENSDQALSSYDVIVPVADTKTVGYRTIPLILDGGRYSTVLMLANTSATTQSYELRIYNGNIFLRNEQLRQSSIAPGSVLFIETAAVDDSARILWAELRSTPAVQGVVAYRGRPGAGSHTGSEAIGNLNAFTSRQMIIPFDETANRETRVFLVNNASSDNVVRFVMRAEDGREMASDVWTFARGEQVYFLVTDYVDRENKGTLEIMSDLPLSALAFRFMHIGGGYRTFTAFSPLSK